LTPLRPTHWDSEAAARWRGLGVWPDEALGDSMARAADRWGAKVAVVDGSSTVTFGRLDELTRRLATVLLGLGVVPGDVVTIQLPSWWETITLIVAAWRVGAVANPVLPNLRAREMEAIAAELDPRVLVVASDFRGFDYPPMVDSIAHRALVIVVRPSSDGCSNDLARLVASAAAADDATLESWRPAPTRRPRPRAVHVRHLRAGQGSDPHP
jgi:cyclohexanecarboxylate-CoA ligase